jgi:hypothetical protein
MNKTITAPNGIELTIIANPSRPDYFGTLHNKKGEWLADAWINKEGIIHCGSDSTRQVDKEHASWMGGKPHWQPGFYVISFPERHTTPEAFLASLAEKFDFLADKSFGAAMTQDERDDLAIAN